MFHYQKLTRSSGAFIWVKKFIMSNTSLYNQEQLKAPLTTAYAKKNT